MLGSCSAQSGERIHGGGEKKRRGDHEDDWKGVEPQCEERGESQRRNPQTCNSSEQT